MKPVDWENDPELEPPFDSAGWDNHLSFTDPDKLATMQDACQTAPMPGDYQSLQEYAHLKNQSIDLGQADLTDRQLLAVTLVFYGGVKKKRAARAMKISSQALTDHLHAALKKIGKSLE